MVESDLVFYEAWQLAQWIAEKKISPIELAKAYLDRIEKLNPRLNAFLTVDTNSTIDQARQAETAVMRGQEIGMLHGLLIPVKDLVQTAGLRTTWGSQVYRSFVPNRDDIVAKRIRAAGGIIIGKTNTSEFGHLAVTENLLTGPCRNPWNEDYASGGSSGGAAVAVATGLSPIAQAGDGGGSIRIPASFCGVFGFKPTNGRIPREYRPHQGGWEIFSQDGPISRSVRDAVLFTTALAGPDPTDPRSLDNYEFTHADLEDRTIQDVRIGLISNFKETPVDPGVKSLICNEAGIFEDLGAMVTEVGADFDETEAREVFKTIFLADMFASVGPLLRRKSDILTPTMREFLEEAMHLGPGRMSRSLRGLEWHRHYFRELFKEYDLLLAPTTAVPGFPVKHLPRVIDGIEVDPMWGFNPFCYHFNMIGSPAATVPCGFVNGLPVGMQIIGRFGEDKEVLRAAAAFEMAKPWAHLRPPNLVTM